MHKFKHFINNQEIAKNANLCSERDIKIAVGRGRWYIKNELIGVIQLKKYRALKSKYEN